jgi:putative copper export protein
VPYVWRFENKALKYFWLHFVPSGGGFGFSVLTPWLKPGACGPILVKYLRPVLMRSVVVPMTSGKLVPMTLVAGDADLVGEVFGTVRSAA